MHSGLIKETTAVLGRCVWAHLRAGARSHSSGARLMESVLGRLWTEQARTAEMQASTSC